MNKWEEQDALIREQTKAWIVSDDNLNNVDFVEIKNKNDFERIPNKGGVYWISTNEPIVHSLHKRKTPQKNNDFEIIYNGLAKDNVRSRIKKHLFREESAGWSAISVDILLEGNDPKSHTKIAMAPGRVKVPYINNAPVRNLRLLSQFNLSEEERNFIQKNSNKGHFYFSNGIDCLSAKHNNFIYRVYFITELSEVYSSFIEKAWRKKCGYPRLCSYKSGR